MEDFELTLFDRLEVIKLTNQQYDLENWYIKERNIKLCDLYYPPYNFTRTGCAGCPYSLSLKDDLKTMSTYLPNERKKCEYIWKPVYEEYRRIGYRLEKVEQLKLF